MTSNAFGHRMPLEYTSDARNAGVSDGFERPGVPITRCRSMQASAIEGEATERQGEAGVRTTDTALMKRTLVAQSKKIQQLAAKIDVLETERDTMREQVNSLQMAVFEASTRAEQTAEQCKKNAVDAAVREIAKDREAFAQGRRVALKRIGELEDALEIALAAAGGVHKRLLNLGLSCEDLGKTSVHLSIAAQDAPAEDKPALAVAGETIEAIVGVMRVMEGSGVFDILDPLESDATENPGGPPSPSAPSEIAPKPPEEASPLSDKVRSDSDGGQSGDDEPGDAQHRGIVTTVADVHPVDAIGAGRNTEQSDHTEQKSSDETQNGMGEGDAEEEEEGREGDAEDLSRPTRR